MTEPTGLNFGTPFQTPAAPSVAPMAVAAPVTGQQLAPIKATEAVMFGQDVLQQASQAAQRINAAARAGDIDELGKSLNALRTEAKKYDPSTLKKGGGFLGLFKVKFQELKNQFATVDQQVNGLLADVDQRVHLFQNRIGDLEQLFNDEEKRYLVLGQLATEYESRVAWMDANPPAVDPGDPLSAQHLADWKAAADMGRKRADDLRRGQALCQMNMPICRQVQQNSLGLVQTFFSVKTDLIPPLQTAFALYIIQMEQSKGAGFADAIKDDTNAALKKNAEMLGQVTTQVQTTLTRSNVDLSTLQAMSAAAIQALDTVEQSRAAMKQRLLTEAPQVQAATQQLIDRLARAA